MNLLCCPFKKKTPVVYVRQWTAEVDIDLIYCGILQEEMITVMLQPISGSTEH